MIYLESDTSKLFAKLVVKNYDRSTAELKENLTHYFYYDTNENIIKHSIRNEKDSIIEQTLFSYDDLNRVETKIYKIVQPKWKKSRPPFTIESFKYNIEKNLVFKTTKKPNKKSSKPKEYPLSSVKIKQLDGNLTLETTENNFDKKGRNEYVFDKLGNIISHKKYSTYPQKNDIKEKEVQLFTFMFDIIYR